MFPSLLQAGIPVLASLRTSISDYNFASRQRPTGMTKQRPSSCTDMELMRDNLDTSVIGTPPAPATGWKFARHGKNLPIKLSKKFHLRFQASIYYKMLLKRRNILIFTAARSLVNFTSMPSPIFCKACPPT